MFKYFISSCCMLCFVLGIAQQNKPIDLQPKDSVVYKQAYGLRAGIDLGRIARTFYDDNYTGFEIAGDYRLTQKIYLAAEVGDEENIRDEFLDDNISLFNYTSSGSYIKVGVESNVYKNWYGEQNSIYIGGRYAFSSFSQTLNNFNIFETNRFFNPDDFAVGGVEGEEFSGLTASWLEFVVGAKFELFSNLYLGASARLSVIITNTVNDEFPVLWIPGFNRVTDNSRFGVGYNYTLTYFLPLYKKSKKNKKKPKPDKTQQ